jgi:uncharacterized membrane protein
VETKSWYTSKTLWVNVIAALAIAAQAATGREIIDAEAQVGLLAVVNVILRLVTKTGIGA